MDHKTVEDYILSFPRTRMAHPFGEGVAVYQVFIPNQPVASHTEGMQGNADKDEKPGDINASQVHGAEEHRNEAYKPYAERDAQSATQQSAASSQQEASLAGLQAAAVNGSWKMFALIAEGKDPVRLSLKCDPLLAKVLREKYETVLEGYHLHKKHWNTIILSGQLPPEELQGLIRHSYDLVTKSDAEIPHSYSHPKTKRVFLG
ncbi:hypothetical protein BH23PAT2_BH23PAT2_01460 [soil metagenome]